jgi:hypothetical protein
VKYYIDEYQGMSWTSKYNVHIFDTKSEAEKKENEILEFAEDNEEYKFLRTDIKEISKRSFTLTHERNCETISIDEYDDLIPTDK